MRKFRLQISVLVLLLMMSIYTSAQGKYNLHIRGAEKDTALLIPRLGLQTSFTSQIACSEYISKLTGILQSKGYATASIDSIRYDSSDAYMVLFAGERYLWARIDAKNIDPSILDGVGWREKVFMNKPMDFSQLQDWQEKLLKYLENNGYPFSKIYLDSLQLDNEMVSAQLKADKGPLYKIDSIRIFGDAKIANSYLQRYLDIPNGSIYNKEKLLRINQKMRELTYVEEERPFDITMLGTGSVLNMYLKQKKSSQINALVGFLPNNDQLASKKILITGEANILLRNSLGAGETIGLNWQQLQVKSPRLNLLYQHPYLFQSPYGLDFSFEMFRKDSNFVNVNFQLGAQYVVNKSQAGKLFMQRFQTIVSQGGVDSAFILNNRKLPDVGDVSSFNVGVDYELNTTDYRLNPRKGNEFRIITSVGTKKLRKNNEILELKDPSDPSFDFDRLYDTVKLKTYQLRVKLMAAKYFPFANKRSTVKTAINAGMFQSGNIFRNELFQLGGYRLLRGFDEESQYLSQFAIATMEYRYLVGQNSFFYVLADGGWGRNNSLNTNVNYTYFGTGLGLAFETKAGIFNLAWAVGKRNDTELNLRQSKIHFGFVNYF
ncbi:MAG: BamA/TamA family outer membrane protein [Chitinophagaceae bacterium]|nr:BamA/TamA family outer membrane protein [Chitinophagaceae bacterium]